MNVKIKSKMRYKILIISFLFLNALNAQVLELECEQGFGFDCTKLQSCDVNWSQLIGTPPNVSIFTNDAGYITGFTETDGVIGNEYNTSLDYTNGTIGVNDGGGRKSLDLSLISLSDFNNDLPASSVNNALITLQRNGVAIGDFTLNQSNNEVFNFIDTDTDTQLSKEQIEDFLNTSFVHTGHTNISVVYNDAANRFEFTSTGGGSTYTANNGLTMTSNNTQLGGQLIQNTTVDLNTNRLSFEGSGGNTYYDFEDDAFTFNVQSGSSVNRFRSAGNAVLLTASDNLNLGAGSTTIVIDNSSDEIKLTSTDLIINEFISASDDGKLLGISTGGKVVTYPNFSAGTNVNISATGVISAAVTGGTGMQSYTYSGDTGSETVIDGNNVVMNTADPVYLVTNVTKSGNNIFTNLDFNEVAAATYVKSQINLFDKITVSDNFTGGVIVQNGTYTAPSPTSEIIFAQKDDKVIVEQINNQVLFSLADLDISNATDVNTSGAASGDILTFDGTNWVDGTDKHFMNSSLVGTGTRVHTTAFNWFLASTNGAYNKGINLNTNELSIYHGNAELVLRTVNGTDNFIFDTLEEYFNHAAADADTDLLTSSMYQLVNDRAVYVKP